MLFAYKSSQFLSSFLVTVLKDDGTIVSVYEFYSLPKAKELLVKWFGSELQWEDKPWDNSIIKNAKAKYEIQTGITFNGYSKEK